MFKLIQKKKYNKMVNDIESYEKALANSDTCICELRKDKYELELDSNYANESFQLLHDEFISLKRDCSNLIKELKDMRKTNRRLINNLYKPKIK